MGMSPDRFRSPRGSNDWSMSLISSIISLISFWWAFVRNVSLAGSFKYGRISLITGSCFIFTACTISALSLIVASYSTGENFFVIV